MLNGKEYRIKYSNNAYASESPFRNLDPRYIPEALLKSWFYHSDMWHIFENCISMSIMRSRLPTSQMLGFKSLLRYGTRKEKRQKFDWLAQKFGKPVGDFSNDENTHIILPGLLDTRLEDDGGHTVYQIFRSKTAGQQEPVLYLTKNADPLSVKRLIDPVAAIDHYAAHVFSGTDEEFDFLAYAEDF